MNIQANGITIEYDTFGSEQDRPLLMIMGLGAQLIAWDEEFCRMLADAGHFVIRFDNRDAGLSTAFDEQGVPDMGVLAGRLQAGEAVESPYTLDDMAADGMALLTGLGIARAHICGASLGGMIAQAMAINYPEAVLSMTSIMSSTGNPLLPPAEPEAMAALVSERRDDPEHAMQRAVEVSRVIGSPGFPMDEERLRRMGLEAYRRAYNPDGAARQMAAVMTHGDRREGLNRLKMPVLVIHGDRDPLVLPAGGRDTHENIPGSELLLVEGMGHDLPPGAWPQLVEAIAGVTGSVPRAE